MKILTKCIQFDNGKSIMFQLSDELNGIADFNYKKIIEESHWKWWPKKGIVSYEKDQTILLHNMIAPFERVSFKNGHKWDCRRENLVDAKGLYGKPTRIGKNIYESTSLYKYCVHRKVIINGQKHWFFTSYSYLRRSKEEAYDKAKETREFIFSMNKEEFIKWKNNRTPNHKSYNYMIQDYSAFNGREVTKSEMYQSGMTHEYDYRNSIQ